MKECHRFLENPQASEVFDAMHRLKRNYDRAMNHELRNTKATKEQGQLMFMITHLHLSQKQIACKMHITEATLSVRMKRLEESGLVTRKVDPEDKRHYVLELTKEGEREVDNSIELMSALHSRMVKGLNEEDYEHIMHILGVLNANLEEEEEEEKK